jgi:hypothetical protein
MFLRSETAATWASPFSIILIINGFRRASTAHRRRRLKPCEEQSSYKRPITASLEVHGIGI